MTLIGDEYKTSLFSGLATGLFACIVALLTIFVIKDDAFSLERYHTTGAFKAVITSTPITENALKALMSDPSAKQGFSDWQDTQMWRYLGQSLVQASMIMTIARVFQVLRDKSTLDKNRVAFLTNNKCAVTFAKMFADVTIFIIPIIIVIAVGLPIISSKGAPVDAKLTAKVLSYSLAIATVYVASTIGLKWINTFSISKVKRFMIFATWLLSSLGLAIIGGMVIGVLNGADHSLNLADHIHDNQILISLLPIANFITPLLSAYGMIDIWTVTPLIGMTLILLISIWIPFSKLQKTYLTT